MDSTVFIQNIDNIKDYFEKKGKKLNMYCKKNDTISTNQKTKEHGIDCFSTELIIQKKVNYLSAFKEINNELHYQVKITDPIQIKINTFGNGYTEPLYKSVIMEVKAIGFRNKLSVQDCFDISDNTSQLDANTYDKLTAIFLEKLKEDIAEFILKKLSNLEITLDEELSEATLNIADNLFLEFQY